MKSIQQWLNEYVESHQHETNKAIHWICVPLIFFSITGLFYGLKLPFAIGHISLNVAMIILALTVIYYAGLSRTIWAGMLVFGLCCIGLCQLIEQYAPVPLWLFCLVIFTLAWIGQFYGHKVEGKKPSFLKDIQFLLIGPAWLMSFIYKKLGIPI